MDLASAYERGALHEANRLALPMLPIELDLSNAEVADLMQRSCKPMGGYKQHDNHYYASVHTDIDRPEMGQHVRMTGEQLRVWRNMGGTDKQLINSVVGKSGRISRVDLAFDLFGYGIDVKRLFEAYKVRWAATHTRSVHAHVSPTGRGQTIYINKRASDVYIRIYDKSAQQNLPKEVDWVRFEVEVKGRRAHQILGALHNDGCESVARGLLAHYIDMSHYKFWGELMGGEIATPQPTGRKLTDGENWLIMSIIPLIEQRAMEGIIEYDRDVIYREVLALAERLKSQVKELDGQYIPDLQR